LKIALFTAIYNIFEIKLKKSVDNGLTDQLTLCVKAIYKKIIKQKNEIFYTDIE
jgi:hypothetical protein